MNLEDIILSEVSLSQRDKHCTIPLLGGNESCQIPRHREWNAGGQGLGRGGSEVVVLNGDRVSV